MNKIAELLETSREVIKDCSLPNGAIIAANSTKTYFPKEAKYYKFVSSKFFVKLFKTGVLRSEAAFAGRVYNHHFFAFQLSEIKLFSVNGGHFKIVEAHFLCCCSYAEN